MSHILIVSRVSYLNSESRLISHFILYADEAAAHQSENSGTKSQRKGLRGGEKFFRNDPTTKSAIPNASISTFENATSMYVWQI